MYNLVPYIITVNDNESLDDNNTVDEEFSDNFTLSRFRKDLMATARDDFAGEYSVGKKSLGRKCKLYI